MADSEQDDEFEAYLKRRVPIDQRMKTVDRLEPPPELDRVIIGKARNAIQNSPQVPMYRAPKWALPVALAATLLIAFSIVLDLGIRSARQQRTASAAAVAQSAAAPAASSEPREMAAAPAPAPTAPVVGARQEIASSGAAASAAVGGSGGTSAKTFARMRPPPIKTAPWPPLRRSTEKPAAPSDGASAEDAMTAESAAAFDPRSRSAERRVAEKRLRTDDSERIAAAAADVSSAPAPSAAPDVAAVARVASAAGAVPVPAPAVPPPPRPLVDATANAGAPEPLRLASSSPKVSAATFDGAKVTEPRAAERFDSVSGGSAARVAPAVAPSAAVIAAADRREHPDPKVWLDQIQKMRVAGLTAQADRELKHFRDAYPSYPTGSPDGGAQ